LRTPVSLCCLCLHGFRAHRPLHSFPTRRSSDLFSADLAAVVSLFVASVAGIPVSTTHTKTTAIMGVGAAKRLSSVNWGIVKEMRSEEHTSELQSRENLVCRLLLEKKKMIQA